MRPGFKYALAGVILAVLAIIALLAVLAATVPKGETPSAYW